VGNHPRLNTVRSDPGRGLIRSDAVRKQFHGRLRALPSPRRSMRPMDRKRVLRGRAMAPAQTVPLGATTGLSGHCRAPYREGPNPRKQRHGFTQRSRCNAPVGRLFVQSRVGWTLGYEPRLIALGSMTYARVRALSTYPECAESMEACVRYPRAAFVGLAATDLSNGPVAMGISPSTDVS
jgi:hypothetical protein